MKSTSGVEWTEGLSAEKIKLKQKEFDQKFHERCVTGLLYMLDSARIIPDPNPLEPDRVKWGCHFCSYVMDHGWQVDGHIKENHNTQIEKIIDYVMSLRIELGVKA